MILFLNPKAFVVLRVQYYRQKIVTGILTITDVSFFFTVPARVIRKEKATRELRKT